MFRQLFISNYSSKHFSSSGGNKRKENSYFQNIRLIWNLSLKNRPTDIVLLGYKSKFSFAGKGRKLKSDFFPLFHRQFILIQKLSRTVTAHVCHFSLPLNYQRWPIRNLSFQYQHLCERKCDGKKKENNESEYIIWLKTKFSELKSEELSCRQYREFILR